MRLQSLAALDGVAASRTADLIPDKQSVTEWNDCEWMAPSRVMANVSLHGEVD